MYFQFAWRYFRSKKSTNAINIISWVSISAIAVGTAALLIILSVFNGFEGFIKDLYNSFYPEIKITAISGKTFSTDYQLTKTLDELDGIKVVSYSIEEKVLLSYGEDQAIATLKGIDQNYNTVTQLDSAVSHGIIDFATKNNIPFYAGNPRKGKGYNFIKNFNVDVIASINYLFLIEEDIFNHSKIQKCMHYYQTAIPTNTR